MKRLLLLPLLCLMPAAHVQRRIEKDDWLPFQSKEDAQQSWQKLGGIRVQVLRAYDLI